MRAEKRQKVTTTDYLVYIANDGTEFHYENDCRDYEAKQAQEKMCSDAGILIECRKAKDYPPFDGGGYSLLNDYRWYHIKDEEGLSTLNALYGLDIPDDHIGKWVAIEVVSGEAFASTLDSCLEYAHALAERLGYELSWKQVKTPEQIAAEQEANANVDG